MPTRPRSRMKRCLLGERRREKVRIAPKGRRRAVVIPILAAPRRVKGRSEAICTVAMVTVVVAGAEEVTFNCGGEKVQVAATGRPLQARATVPLKLLVGAALTMNVAEEPGLTVAVEAEVLKP